MKRLCPRLVCIALLPASLFVLSTCGKDSSTNPTPPPPPAQVPASIEITPSSATLNAIDQTVELAAEVLDQNGSVIDDASVTWTSGALDVAAVSGQGLVTAVNNGSAVITAQSGSLSASASITVSQTPVRIEIEQQPSDIGLKLEATVQDSNGHPVAGAEVTWSSSDESVATVNDQGLVTTISSGVAEITARYGDRSATIAVIVPDRFALGTFYEATGGPDWTHSTNWLTDAPLEEWHGITVLSLPVYVMGPSGSVAGLNLFDNNLGGSIPMEVGQLRSLEELNLGSNRISGEIPATIGKLENLGKLNLSNNQLSGEIPAELGYLANLRGLYLQGNESLSGPLPDSFTNLELQTLNLGETELCVPAGPEFQTWIEGIENVTASPCPDPEIEAP